MLSVESRLGGFLRRLARKIGEQRAAKLSCSAGGGYNKAMFQNADEMIRCCSAVLLSTYLQIFPN